MGTEVVFLNTAEHLAAKELDIICGKPKQNLKKRIYWNIGVTLVRWQKTQLAGVACSVCKEQRWSNWTEFSHHSFHHLDLCFSPCDMWKCPNYIDDVMASNLGNGAFEVSFSLSGSSCCKYRNTQIVLTQRMERDCYFNHFVISGVDSSYLYANPSVDVSPDATEARRCTRSALLQECRQAEWKFTGCP